MEDESERAEDGGLPASAFESRIRGEEGDVTAMRRCPEKSEEHEQFGGEKVRPGRILNPSPSKEKAIRTKGRAEKMVMMSQQLGRLVRSLKSKMKSLRGNKRPIYDKMDKTESMRVEIRSRRAQKLIVKNLKMADSMVNSNNKAFIF
ncbi:hypothetical protein ZIOFF_067190 [Zingiber officinale]|uniref:Uncharacterized protein n=1 Tax=Zingiber officinale TaxID=94328 RepID=A0A8J5CCZ7_ZINOF|nr:hypothetical protein ZIOFF_067190 [Zingiber officinale]